MKKKDKSLNNLLNQAINDGYIEKNGLNNYVCFGSSDEECPKENLYRIIGVFGSQVKLIKADEANKNQLGIGGSYNADWVHEHTYIGDSDYKKHAYYWNKEGENKTANWADSSLNNVNLNTDYVNYLKELDDGISFAKIANTAWQVGGMTYQNGHTKNAKIAYDYELGKNSTNLTDENYVGLMYVSDYYYAAEPEFWTLMGHNFSKQDVSIDKSSDYRGAIWNNWLFNGDGEWTITPTTENSTGAAFRVDYIGSVNTSDVILARRTVRPCFYLKYDVKYISGDGSLNNPYRIN